MPPKFETIMEDVDVHVGETSRLAVVVEGKPDPDILWYKVRCFIVGKLASVMFVEARISIKLFGADLISNKECFFGIYSAVVQHNSQVV